MKGWLLDTNVVASLIAPDGAPSVKQWVARQDETRLFLSVLTLGEYEKGLAQLPDGDSRRLQVTSLQQAIQGRFRGRILPLTDTVVSRWGSLSGRIRRDTGHPPPVIDTLIAATAIENGLYLVTRNIRDVKLTGAAIFDPWSDDPTAGQLSR